MTDIPTSLEDQVDPAVALPAALSVLWAMSAKLEALKAALHPGDRLVQLLEIDIDPLPAAGTGVVTLALKLSDAGLSFVAAARAGRFDLVLVDDLLEHLSSSVVFDTNRAPRPGESDQPARPVGADGGAA